MLTWQLQDNVTLLDTFYMSWHKARGHWNFCDDNIAVWEKEIRQAAGDAWQPGNPANTFLETELQGKGYHVEVIVWRYLACGGTTSMDFDALEPSRFHKAFVGVELPVHYEWARFSTQPFTEKLTPLQELRRAATKLAEDIQICSSRGFTCSVCKAKGGVEREQFMSFDLTRGAGLLPETEAITLQRPIDLPVCPLCQTRHCCACADACAARKAAAKAAEVQERATQKLNVEARGNKKRLRKTGALKPTVVQPDGPAEDAADHCAPEPVLSKKASRRREQRAKQRKAVLRLENKAAEREEEENRKLRKQVERLKLTSDTTVQQSLEALDSIKALEAALSKENPEKRGRPVQPPQATELQKHLLENSLRGSRMRAEAAAFVAAYSGTGLAPADASFFSERLVQTVLHGRPHASGDAYDTLAMAAVFGDFADAFCSHEWAEPCLRVGRYVVITAAAATEQASIP